MAGPRNSVKFITVRNNSHKGAFEEHKNISARGPSLQPDWAEAPVERAVTGVGLGGGRNERKQKDVEGNPQDAAKRNTYSAFSKRFLSRV